MESHTKSPECRRYRIRTEKLSYKLRRENIEDNCCSFLLRREVTPTTCILKNVTCEARAGEVSAIAGPSGAGKTTLLEILAGMIPLSRISGKVMVNDRPMSPRHFRSVSGHVAQDHEALFSLLTVEETLTYSARLRLRGSRERATQRVRVLLRELGLEHVAASRVGSDGSSRRRRGISGGEKRRVSIGVDLVHDPAVLFLDEPTSGLDSASALHVALLLKSMAVKHGKTVVMTIHQPGFRILQLFDQILLLSGGALLHNGSLGLLERRLGEAGYDIPRHVNALEFAIEVGEALGIEDSEQEEHCDHQIINNNNNENRVTDVIVYANPPLKEILILSQRFSSNICRTKQLFAARIAQAVAAGLVLGTIFMKSTKESDPNRVIFRSQLGFFAFSLTFLLSSTTEGLPIYLRERRVLMRESSRGAYRVSSYVIANFLVFLPFLMVVAFLFAAPVYWLVGLRGEIGAFLYFWLVVWLVVLMSNSFVACLSALVPDFISGTMLVAGLMGAFFLFSGYFIAEEDMPKCWIFMHYLSLFKYPFECFIVNEYGGEGGRQKCLATLGGECVLFGDKFLEQKRLRESQKWSNLSVMLGFIFGYRFLCFLILWCRAHRGRV